MSEQKYKCGDMLLFKTMPNIVGWLQFLCDGPAGHMELILDADGNNAFTLGMAADGLKYRNHMVGSNHCVLRLDQPIDELKMQEAARSVYLDSNKTYAWGKVMECAFSQLMDRVTLSLWKKHVPIQIGTSRFCSSTVAEVYRRYPGFTFSRQGEENIDPSALTPSDPLKCRGIIMIKPFI